MRETRIFCDEWMRTSADWQRFRVPATECPRISARFLEEERAPMGDRRFRQEYLCEFMETDSGASDLDLVERAMSYEFEPLRIQ